MKEIFLVPQIRDWTPCVQRVMSLLSPGSILALSGPLGAGKTTFVQELLQAFGVTVPVKSPTFSLLRTYTTTHSLIKRVLHVDAYRLEREEDVLVLNLDEELATPGTIACIEWPEKLPYWLTAQAERVIWLTIMQKEDTREATLELRG